MNINIVRVKSFFSVLIICAIALACTRNAAILGPKEYYINPIIESETSMINAIGEVSTLQAEQLINTRLPDILYEDNNIEDDNYTVKVSKRTSFLLEPEGEYIFITAPLKIDAKARLNVGFIRAEQNGSFDLDVRFRLQPKITNNWEIKTFTKIVGYNWINEPKVKLGPFEVSVAPYLEKMIVNQQDQISKKIDEMVKKSIDLKPFAEKAWALAQRPIPLIASINAWTKIEPKEIYFIPVSGTKETIKFGIGMKANLETSFGNKPSSTNSTLPSISLGASKDSLFAVHLLSKIGFKEASQLANEKIANSTFTFDNDKYKVKIEEISFYGSGDNLVAKALLSGDYNGLVYLNGIPEFDSTASVIKIKNLDFTAESVKGLKRTYAWLFKGNLTKKLTQYLEFSINSKSKLAAEALSKYLNEINLSDKIKIEASVFNLQPSKIWITQDQLVVSIQAKGKIGLKIDLGVMK